MEVTQIIQQYKVEITMSMGHKIELGVCCGDLIFKTGKDGYKNRLMDVTILVGTQKTLGSTKPTYAVVNCPYNIDDTGLVNLGDKFVIYDPADNFKVGKGHIIEIVKQ